MFRQGRAAVADAAGGGIETAKHTSAGALFVLTSQSTDERPTNPGSLRREGHTCPLGALAS